MQLNWLWERASFRPRHIIFRDAYSYRTDAFMVTCDIGRGLEYLYVVGHKVVTRWLRKWHTVVDVFHMPGDFWMPTCRRLFTWLLVVHTEQVPAVGWLPREISTRIAEEIINFDEWKSPFMARYGDNWDAAGCTSHYDEHVVIRLPGVHIRQNSAEIHNGDIPIEVRVRRWGAASSRSRLTKRAEMLVYAALMSATPLVPRTGGTTVPKLSSILGPAPDDTNPWKVSTRDMRARQHTSRRRQRLRRRHARGWGRNG